MVLFFCKPVCKPIVNQIVNLFVNQFVSIKIKRKRADLINSQFLFSLKETTSLGQTRKSC